MFVAPERAMSSAVITKIAEAVRESVCSFFDTEVTWTFIRSSRLLVVRSVESCCDHAGNARNPTRAICARVREVMRSRNWLLFPPLRLRIPFPFTQEEFSDWSDAP